jgi:hypothetical protein
MEWNLIIWSQNIHVHRVPLQRFRRYREKHAGRQAAFQPPLFQIQGGENLLSSECLEGLEVDVLHRRNACAYPSVLRFRVHGR